VLGAAKVHTRADQATVITPCILAGAMRPVTVAGTCAQTLAETLARSLGVPLRSGGGLCGSKIADTQAASESSNTPLPPSAAQGTGAQRDAGTASLAAPVPPVTGRGSTLGYRYQTWSTFTTGTTRTSAEKPLKKSTMSAPSAALKKRVPLPLPTNTGPAPSTEDSLRSLGRLKVMWSSR